MKNFWNKVLKTRTCWIWQGERHRQGYGRLRHDGKRLLAHRMSWFLIYGEWPTQDLLHSCDNPPCVNPEHLSEGTMKDNIQDSIRKGRFKFTEKGEKHPNAKLTNGQAQEIRERYSKEKITQKNLAGIYGVAIETVNDIVRERSYLC